MILVQKDSADAANVGRLLADRLNRSTGLGIAVSTTEGAGAVRNAILLTTKNADAALKEEIKNFLINPAGRTTGGDARPFLGTRADRQSAPKLAIGAP